MLTNASQSDRLLTAGEVARLMDVPVESVLRWVGAGALQHTRTEDGDLRFDRDIVPVGG